jgi:hypothetical protein
LQSRSDVHGSLTHQQHVSYTGSSAGGLLMYQKCLKDCAGCSTCKSGRNEWWVIIQFIDSDRSTKTGDSFNQTSLVTNCDSKGDLVR